NTANEKLSQDAVTEFEVRIRILNDSYKDLIRENRKYSAPFRPGMTASVDIITNKKENVLSVPLAAVTTRNPNDNKKIGDESNDNDAETNADDPENQDSTNKSHESEDVMKEVVFVKKG